MKSLRFVVLGAAVALASLGIRSTPTTRQTHDVSETVMITFCPKAGSEAELARVIAHHWTTARRLDLVLPGQHLTVRAEDERGRPYFVDIFTWRTAEIPDHAPAEIQAIWADMNRLTEAREGKAGLAIVQGSIVAGS